MTQNFLNNNNQRSNDHREQSLDSLVQTISQRSADQAGIERVINNALQLKAVDRRSGNYPFSSAENSTTADGNPIRPLNRRPRNLMRWICGLAAAIAIVLAFGALFVSGGNAFAQVQAAVARIRSVQFRVLDFHGDQEPFVSSTLIVTGLGARGEGPNGIEHVTNLRDQKSMMIDHKTKTVTISQLYTSDDSPALLETFFTIITELPANQVKKLEPVAIDGKLMNRYEFQDHGTFVITVDPDSHLPTRMEMNLVNGLPQGQRFREVITDFVYDVAVDESRFAITPPANYQVEETASPADRQAINVANIVVSPETGFDGLVFGSSKEQVIAKLGKPDSIEESKIPMAIVNGPVQGGGEALLEAAGKQDPAAVLVISRLSYQSLGFELTIGGQGLESVRCFGRSRMGDMATEFLGATDKGARLGVSMDEITRLYGPPEVRTTGRNDMLYYPHIGYQFLFGDSKLVEISMRKPMSDDIKVRDNGDGTWSESLKGSDDD